MAREMSLAIGTGKIGLCIGCFQCSDFSPVTKVLSGSNAEFDGIGFHLSAVFVKETSKERYKFDQKVANQMRRGLNPDLWTRLQKIRKGFKDKKNSHRLLFVDRIPCCYRKVELKIELDVKSRGNYSITVPDADFLQTQNRLLNDLNFKASDFDHKTKGFKSNKSHTFVLRHTDAERNHSQAFMDLAKVDSNGIVANDAEQLNEELNGLLFGKKKLESTDLPGEDRVLNEWEERKLADKVLRTKPTAEERSDSARVKQKLDSVQRKTFDILQSALGRQGCETLITDEPGSSQSESWSEMLANYFFASGWQSYATDHDKSQLTLPLPRGMLLNDSFKPSDSKEKAVKLNMHQQAAGAFQCESLNHVNVKVNSEALNMQLTVTQTNEAIAEAVQKVVKKNKKWVAHEIIQKVRDEQLPVFKLQPSDLNPDLDVWFPFDTYERKTLNGISYIQPNHDWVRIHINTDKYLSSRPWLHQAAIAYHGSGLEGCVGIAKDRSFRTDGLSLHEKDKDVNPQSDTNGQPCGKGAYFADDPQRSVDFAYRKKDKLIEGKYCVFEVKLNPKKTKVPCEQTTYRIVSEPLNALPSGICVYVGIEDVAKFGNLVFKRWLKYGQLLATTPSFAPERYFLANTQGKLNPYIDDSSKKFQHFKLKTWCGPPNLQRDILILGSTNSGKTTLINGMLNYLLDVQYTADYYRFELPNPLEASIYPGAKIAGKQTNDNWFSSYAYVDNVCRYTFIDTPSFNSKLSGLTFGQRLINFLTECNFTKFDAICYVVPEQNGAISQYESIMLNKICSLFDNNASQNLYLFTTFGINGFQSSFAESFPVDNSCLYTRSPKAERLWTHTFRNYDRFFNSIKAKRPTVMVSQVMRSNPVELENATLALDATIQNLLYQSTNLNREKEKLFDLRQEINQMNMNNYSFKQQEPLKISKPPGIFVTVCLLCKETCHDNCIYENDYDKHQCSAMGPNGYCMHCADRCLWNQHSNTPFFYHVREVDVSRSILEWLEKFSIKENDLQRAEKVVANLEKLCAELLVKMLDQIGEIESYMLELEQLDTNASQNRQQQQNRRRYIDKLKAKERRDENIPGSRDRLTQLEKADLGRDYLKQIIDQVQN